MRKLSLINEDLFHKSVEREYTGGVRKEDSVDTLDMDGFVEYLKKHYTYDKESKSGIIVDRDIQKRIVIPVNPFTTHMDIVYSHDCDSIIALRVTGCERNTQEMMKVLLEREFGAYSYGGDAGVKVTNRDMEITNTTCLDFLNTVIDNMKDSFVKRV